MGLISNSSSTSFVILGYRVEASDFTDEQKIELLRKIFPDTIDSMIAADKYGIENVWYDKTQGTHNGFDISRSDSAVFFGAEIISISSDGSDIDDAEIPLEAYLEKCHAAEKLLGFERKNLKIHTGSYSS